MARLQSHHVKELATLKDRRKSLLKEFSVADVFAAGQSIDMREEQLKNFARIQAALGKKGLIAVEVPADGNCALHTILSLENSSLPRSTPDEIQAMRNEIADAWVAASSSSRWLTCYFSMSEYFDDVADGVYDEEDKLDCIKKEPNTPKKTPSQPLPGQT